MGRMGTNAGWAGWARMPDGPDGQDSLSIRMESGWAGMPDRPDGVYRMDPGWVPTAQIMILEGVGGCLQGMRQNK